jgi:hypothetical protein
MNITLDEAALLLDSWKATGTLLRVHLLRAGQARELQAKVKDIESTVVNFDAGGEEIAVDLGGADFNGDRRAPLNSSHGAYLICEYRNGDRFSFYATRPAQQETGYRPTDRRSEP